jgi:pyruvate-formate lyase-activating enzyme
MNIPSLVVSDRNGNIIDVPGLLMVGSSGGRHVVPVRDDLVPLPLGSNLFVLPDRDAVGFDPRKNEFVTVTEYEGERVFAAAAFMAPAYLQILTAASVPFHADDGGCPTQRLPLFSYTALGYGRKGFYAAGMRIDPDRRQDLELVDLALVERRARSVRKRYAGNRLVEHLIDNCVFCYGCPAARNFALGRWECPVPTSIACNSRCVGCISKQPGSSGVVQSQNRIAFVPTVDEILEFTVPHLETAERAVISFGQGCEGEPLHSGDVIEGAIRAVRKRTSKGIINLNTNGSLPDVVERLCAAGLDSIRVSLNSAHWEYYGRYFRPSGYCFEDVVRTLEVVRRYGIWSSVNYFMFPGFTDTRAEFEEFERLVRACRINMVQTRNLNIDPDWYIETLGSQAFAESGFGIREWVARTRKNLPWIRLGYFNPPREEMRKEHYEFV